MIELIRFKQQAAAALAVQILAQRGIVGQVVEQDQFYLVVLADAGQFDAGRTLLDDWLANPNDPRFSQAAWNSNQTLANSGALSTGAGNW